MPFVKRFAALAVFVLLAVLALAVSIFMPRHNWDMIGYVAAAKSFEEKDPAALQKFTFGQVRAAVSEDEYRALTSPESGHGEALYRAAVATDPEVFAEQLPFYQIRPLYNGCVYLLYKCGVNIVQATYLLSGFAVFCGILLLYAIGRQTIEQVWYYVIPPLAVIFGVLDVARLSTPDGLAFCVAIFCVLLYLANNHAASLILFPVLIGVRTDLILFAAPFLAVLYVQKLAPKWGIALSGLASIAIYAAIVTYWPHPGWAATLYSAGFPIPAHPLTDPPVLTLVNYFRLLGKGVAGILTDKAFIVYAIIVYCAIVQAWRRGKAGFMPRIFVSQAAGLIFVSLFYVISHLLLFPVVWDRFFAAQYLMAAIALLSLVLDFDAVLKQIHE